MKHESRDGESLATATDAVLFQYTGAVRTGHAYTVFSCPSNPSYRWGNRIHFTSQESITQIPLCERLMADEFFGLSQIRHSAFSWDVESYHEFPSDSWRSEGYDIELSDTLVLTHWDRKQGIHNRDIIVRPLCSDFDWHQAVECQVLVRSLHWGEDEFRSYLIPKFSTYRKLTEEGFLTWIGAFLHDGTQVGNLGVLFKVRPMEGSLIARFQMVATHPTYQRRGVCTSLLHEALQQIFKRAEEHQLPSVTAVIVADPEYHAKQIYKKVGFSEIEYQVFATKALRDQ